jgi:outer membrane protein TolC
MKRLLLLGVCQAAFTIAVASPAAAQSPLTLTSAIEAALSHSPALGAARAGADAGRALSKASRGEWFPRIQFSESWRQSNQPVSGFGNLLNAGRFTADDFAVSRLNAPGAVNGFSRRIGLSQIAFDGGRTRALVEISAAREKSGDAKVQAAELDVALRVTEAYGALVTAAAQLSAAQAAVAWADEDRSRADARRRAGTATDADVLTAGVFVADMRQRVIQAEGDVVSARAALNSLMGEPLDRVYAVELPALPSETPALIDLTRTARTERPELRDANEVVAAAEAAARLARASFLPALAADAGYEWNGLDFGHRQASWNVGAELRWSISTGGGEAARAAAARLSADAARASRDAVIAAIDLDVVTARQRWIVALARLDAGRAAAEQARESQRIIRRRYAAGMASMTDVLAAASAAFTAEAQETANRVGLVTAWSQLQRAVGRSFSSPTR